MKHLILLTFSCLLVACNSTKEVYNGPSLLYKLEGKDIKENVYIFGTIHLISKDKFSFPEMLEEKMQAADTVVMEVGNLDPIEAMKYMMLEEGSLFDFFNEHQKDSILYWAESTLHLKQEMFELSMGKAKPFVIMQMATQMLDLDQIESYELTITKKAKQNSLPTKGLETIQQQIGFFDDMDSSLQASMVMEAIREQSTGSNMMEELERIYLTQNIDSMHLFIQEEGGALAEVEETLLTNRNKNWVPQIIQMAKYGNVFVAVGAGHLGGENGVIQLLKNEGYQLLPVKLDL